MGDVSTDEHSIRGDFEVATTAEVHCYHCGQPCEEVIAFDEKNFCCFGCKTVFEILNDNNLCQYYELDKNAGVSMRNVESREYDYLDEEEIRKKLLTFNSADLAQVQFRIPSVHCVSCIWLLESLRKLEPGVIRSEVNFARKSVTIDFNPTLVGLRRIASRLAALGYAPVINLDSEESSKTTLTNKGLILRLAVAGFCFGNVMLFSFPEYLGLDRANTQLATLFGWLNMALSVPVFLYSGLDYFTSARNAFRQRQINIDVPIAIGLLALFFRSLYDVITATGPGYFDSFTGLVFFLLIGRWFQGKTYENLAFDRDFKSYFPLAIQRIEGGEPRPVLVRDLRKGDTILLRNMEVLPTDAKLIDEGAFIDYSFVTGESKPVRVSKGDIVYAGGRIIGQPVTLVVEKGISQSRLTSLWNSDAFRKEKESSYQKRIDRAARVFTWVILGIALSTAVWWYIYEPQRMWLVLTSVLMVACPCALALAAPFTYGNILRVMGKHGLYLKNADVVERIAAVDAIVFDKTGTVTHGDKPEIVFVGKMTPEQWKAIKALTAASTHPLSMLIARSIPGNAQLTIEEFSEIPAKGIKGLVAGQRFRLGSAEFVTAQKADEPSATTVYVAVDGKVLGHFRIKTSVRRNFKVMLDRLGRKCVALLSGDNEAERSSMETLFGPSVQLLFEQSPQEKMEFIRSLQQEGRKVLMVGDGLNDSGALKQSDVGLAVTDDTGVFTPACDGILDGRNIAMFDRFLVLAKYSSRILLGAFMISFLYNAIALSVAVAGYLTPLVAAILMPLSSISVVSFATVAVNWAGRRVMGMVNNTRMQLK